MNEDTLDRASILMVDDRPDKLLALEAILEEPGIDLIRATSGNEALRLLLKHEVALILLDVSMPEMDGFETAALIRQRKQSEHTPIIFITSINTNETHVTRGYSLGAVDYIFSPIESEVIKAKVGVFIDLHKKTLQIKRQSEMLRLEAERRASTLEDRLQTLLNSLDVGVFRLSTDNKLLEANPAFLRLLGFSSLDDRKVSELVKIVNRAKRDIGGKDSRRSAQDFHWHREDGTSVWISLTISKNTLGEVSEIEGLVEDISARKGVEAELQTLNENLELMVIERTEALRQSEQAARRSERLAALGTLAAGIAHEINNPLNSILMATELATRKSHEAKTVTDSLEIIANATRRCGKIVKGVLQFARDEKRAKSTNDLNSVIRSATELARTYVLSPLSVELDLAPNPLPILLNQNEIEQVIVNIIQNAAEASPEEAHVVITTSSKPKKACVTIADSGPGIPEEHQMKIFDPFYSTKLERGGTGLGLSVVHGIITEHGGVIRVSSTSGVGTSFSIELPLSEQENSNASGTSA